MKVFRFVVVLVAVLTITATLLIRMPLLSYKLLPKMFSSAVAYVYCKGYDGTCVRNGNGCIVTTTCCNVDDVINNCVSVDGVSISFDGSYGCFERIAETFGCTVTQIDGVAVGTGYCGRIIGGVTIDGKAVNVQVAYNNGTISIGSPLILGSY